MEESRTSGDIPTELRREQMLAFIETRDFVRVSDLSARFSVSEVTIRGDLEVLAEQGKIRRIRGGARPRSYSFSTEQPFEEARVNEKALIGRAAAALVSSGETIILDVGTTTTAVARALTMREDLYDIIIFTNSINIALELENTIPRFTVIVIGGTLRPMQHSLVDPLGGLMLDKLNTHTLFLGCNGVNPTSGITNVNLPEAEVKRRMLRVAHRRIVVADGSKIGSVKLAHLCGIDEVDLLITDSSADPAILKALREKDLEILIAK